MHAVPFAHVIGTLVYEGLGASMTLTTVRVPLPIVRRGRVPPPLPAPTTRNLPAVTHHAFHVACLRHRYPSPLEGSRSRRVGVPHCHLRRRTPSPHACLFSGGHARILPVSRATSRFELLLLPMPAAHVALFCVLYLVNVARRRLGNHGPQGRAARFVPN
jgi:hypothetical protein